MDDGECADVGEPPVGVKVFLLIKHCAFEEIFGFVNFAGLRRRD